MAVLVNFFLPNAAFVQGLHLIGGDAYLSKIQYHSLNKFYLHIHVDVLWFNFSLV